MKYIILCVMTLFSFYTHSFAQEYPSGASIFIEKINSACKNADAESFRSLYCTNLSGELHLNLPRDFTSSDKTFIGADFKKVLIPGSEWDGKYVLDVCYKFIPSGEERCQIFDLVQEGGQICIDGTILEQYFTTIDVIFPEGFEKAELGIAYSELQKIFENGDFIKMKLQAEKVSGLISDVKPYHAKIMNFIALCLRVGNVNINGFGKYPNKQNILNLYMKAYQIGVENSLQNTATFSETLFQLADCLEQNGQYQDAMKFRKERYLLMKRLFGDNDIRTADALDDIGHNYSNQGISDLAISHLEKEIEVLKSIKRTGSIEVIQDVIDEIKNRESQ